jgi:hypothetical protein
VQTHSKLYLPLDESAFGQAVELLHREAADDCSGCVSLLLETPSFRIDDRAITAFMRARCCSCLKLLMRRLFKQGEDHCVEALVAVVRAAVREDVMRKDAYQLHCVQQVTAALEQAVEAAEVQALVFYALADCDYSAGIQWLAAPAPPSLCDVQLVNAFFSRNADFAADWHPLQRASDVDTLTALLEAGLDVYVRMEGGNTALHCAAIPADASSLEHVKPSERASAVLHAAAAQQVADHRTVQQLLLNQNDEQQTAVHIAVHYCDSELLAVLLNAAASAAAVAAVLAVTESGELTPALLAATQCCKCDHAVDNFDTHATDMFRVLVTAASSAACLQAVMRAADAAGATVVQLLQRKGYTQWLSILSDNGMQVGSRIVYSICTYNDLLGSVSVGVFASADSRLMRVCCL